MNRVIYFYRCENPKCRLNGREFSTVSSVGRLPGELCECDQSMDYVRSEILRPESELAKILESIELETP